MKWETGDGEEVAFVFLPWGRFKYNGQYRTADFSELQKFCFGVSDTLRDLTQSR